jgi:ribonuclease BN (tRNA processing enzyme)
MKLLLLGTIGYHPNDRGHTTGLMLPEIGVMFDAGSGTYRIRDLLCTPTLDIFLTHAHLDHVIGLTFLLGVLNGKQISDVRVHGMAEKLEAVRTHLFAEHLFPVPPPFEDCPLSGPVTLSDGGVVNHFSLAHPGGSVGYRVDWADRSFALVTDTMATEDAPYVDAIRGVDLLVHECYFPDGMEEHAAVSGHSCMTPVAKLAKAAEVKRMVLIHVAPSARGADPVGMTAARKIYSNMELGCDGMEIDF